MQTLKERLREVMSAKEWEQADLMRVSGESSSVVSQWLGKGSKEIKSIGKMEAAERIEAASGFAALWVAKGLGPKFEARPAETRVAHGVSEPRPTMRLQRLAWEDLMDVDLTQPFEVEVFDDALGPDIYRGCVARMDPDARPRPGRPVLVRDRYQVFYLRDYEVGAAGHWRAVARQPGYAPLDSVEHGLQLVAVMKGVDWP